MKIAAITLVVTLASAFGVWVTGLFRSGEDEAGGTQGTYAVRRGSLPITLTERGTLKTKNSTVIRAETHAKIEWLGSTILDSQSIPVMSWQHAR